jgi:curved DNA-binding protein CbpA
VNEAYQILSVIDSRVNYDLRRKKNPDLFKTLSPHDYNLENRIDMRDKSGIV